MFISVFCKSYEPSCELICQPEIVLKNFAADFQANSTDIRCKIFEQFQVHTTWVHNSYKTRKLSNKLTYHFGKSEEYVDLSCIYLAVHDSLSDLQSCGATFPWGPLAYLILGGVGAGGGYYIGDTYFTSNSTNVTQSNDTIFLILQMHANYFQFLLMIPFHMK